MTFTTARRSLSLALASLLAAGAVALGAGGAEADVLGSMEIAPATGTDTSGITLTTSGPCPEGASNLIVSVKGSGFPAEGQNVVSNSPIDTYGATGTGGIVVPLTQTMRDYASTAGFSTLQGRYDFTLTCRAAFGSTTYGDFTAPLWFTSDTTYRSTPPAAVTTTALAATPASPVVQGTAVKLTATLAPADAAGTVRFLDGAAQLGAPVPVSAGTATLTTSALAVGTHTVKAEFTPKDPAAYGPSASAVLSYTVKIKPPVVTTPPKVTGTAKVGSTVTCTVAFGGATTLRYVWLRDTAQIAGATARTRPLVAADYAHKTACRATAANSTGSTTATSPAVSVGAGPALRNGTRPSITGTARVGYRQTAKPGTWSPAATTYSYVWKRDGRVIKGATRATYYPTAADRRHLLTVTVTAKRPGYAWGSATSTSRRIG
ncbi:Ig-like domain-containing protein [Streptomyces sp. NBC_00829]|uniref:Ig-like domain-containing protein n=1 Tax=Streptomyces sp. NBC_00829 TaxID=2903679 RepID=UPI00386CDB4F|nr:Ig-like domain-containing protein [Streptomyces sp. NBC_00829]